MLCWEQGHPRATASRGPRKGWVFKGSKVHKENHHGWKMPVGEEQQTDKFGDLGVNLHQIDHFGFCFLLLLFFLFIFSVLVLRITSSAARRLGNATTLSR